MGVVTLAMVKIHVKVCLKPMLMVSDLYPNVYILVPLAACKWYDWVVIFWLVSSGITLISAPVSIRYRIDNLLQRVQWQLSLLVGILISLSFCYCVTRYWRIYCRRNSVQPLCHVPCFDFGWYSFVYRATYCDVSTGDLPSANPVIVWTASLTVDFSLTRSSSLHCIGGCFSKFTRCVWRCSWIWSAISAHFHYLLHDVGR